MNSNYISVNKNNNYDSSIIKISELTYNTRYSNITEISKSSSNITAISDNEFI
jgi:hypothetical protein